MVSSPTLSAYLHDLRHEFAHLFGGTFLHLPRDVGISSQREARVEVAEHTGYCLYVHAILERQCRECVSQVMKSQVFQSCIFQDFLVDVDYRIRMVHFRLFSEMGTSMDCLGVSGVLRSADQRHPAGWRFF